MNSEEFTLAPPSQPDRETVAETSVLARILAEQRERHIAFLVSEAGESLPNAIARVEEHSSEYFDHVRSKPPDAVAWADLNWLEPEQTLECWNKIKDAARDEIVSGMYAADQFNETPYTRAQFLVIRAAFLDQWQPANDGERLLVDMLAQQFWAYNFWLGVSQSRACLDIQRERDNGKASTTGKRKPTRLTDAEAETHAAEQVDRMHRLFMRTLRGLRDLRRYGASVTIQSAGQVNIGAQQVNAAKVEK